jgi:hypothetical protein
MQHQPYDVHALTLQLIVYDESNSNIRRHASSRAAWLNGGVPGQKNACCTPG